MKKLALICICLTLMVTAIAPTIAFAADGSAEDIIYFLNPTSITAVDDYLFVADKIEDNKSAIHCFDISNDNPEHTFTLVIDDIVLNLSGNGSDLYAITQRKGIKLEIADNGLALTDETIEVTNDAIVDIAFSDDNIILLTRKVLKLNGEDGYRERFTNGDAVTCAVSGDYLYYLFQNNDEMDIKRRQTSNFLLPQDDNFNNNLSWPQNFQPIGIFAWNNSEVAIFGSHSIYYSSNSNLTLLKSTDTYAITDVCISGDKIFILNDNHQITVYKKGSSPTELSEVATIGSDQVQQDVPDASQYESFTLVRSTGYPTNIVFRTNGDNSIGEIETKASEFVVIGYEGSENSKFYYVFIRDKNGDYKFGWVKKSDNAEDSKLEVINTKVEDDDQFGQHYKTRFNSLRSVWLYDLPCSEFQRSEPFIQTASSMAEVTVLQRFEEIKNGETVAWLYVSYQDGDVVKTAFVHEVDVGRFLEIDTSNGVVGQRKINASLFDAVTVYENWTDMDKETPTGKTFKLYSGDVVTLIEEHDGIALIQKVYSDGTTTEGYVYVNQLIGEYDVTTNAIVGMTLLAIAIALTVTLVVVFQQRKKRKNSKANSGKENK